MGIIVRSHSSPQCQRDSLGEGMNLEIPFIKRTSELERKERGLHRGLGKNNS